MRALITGITGFAGSHLAEYLLAEHPDVEVYGTFRWRSRMENVEHLDDQIKLVEADLRDYTSMHRALEITRPDYIFHLAAQSFVPASWNAPNDTVVTNVTGQTNLFEAIRALKLDPVVQIACSSEEYGLVLPHETPIKEENPLRPLSPYAVSKVAQDYLGYQYFQSYGIKAIRTRGFNHTGPRRGQVFVTSNFCSQVASIELGHPEAGDPGGEHRRHPRLHRRARHGARLLAGGHQGEARRGLQHRDRQRHHHPRHAEPRPLPLQGGGEDRGRPRPPAPLGRRDPDRRQLEVPRRHRLGAADPLRADGQRPARLLAPEARPPQARLLMRILVTGIGGFVGSRLARHLLAAGDRVSGTWVDARPRLEGADLFEADLQDRAALERAIRTAAPDAVVHLAGLSHIGDSWDWQKMPGLLPGQRRGDREPGRRGRGRGRSAGGDRLERRRLRPRAGGRAADPRVPPRRPADPVRPHQGGGRADRAGPGEKGAIICRSFNLVGPGQSPKFSLASWAAQLAEIKRGERQALDVGDLSTARDFVHVDDGAAAYRLLAEKGRAGGRL